MSISTNHSISLLLLLRTITALSQTQETLFEQIPNAQVGECYSECYMPDQYKNKVEQILLKEAYTAYQTIPAVYDTLLLSITEKPAYITLTLQPPTFDIQAWQVPISDTLQEQHYTPPQFETITEQILVQPATQTWQKTAATHNCLNNPDKNNCQVWCLTEQPAQYRTIQRQILKTPAQITQKQIPPRHLTLQRAVLKQAARLDTQYIAAQTRQIKTLKLRTPATQIPIEVSAEFSSVTRKEIIKPASLTPYVKVMCDTSYPTILDIQKALKALGYQVPLDNVLELSTRKALIDYQKKNNLPVGNLNTETLRKLGVWIY